ncbi:SWIM zinc finger family protein [Streptomyces venezuelae]|uniref:SWIM zinc finger family protein n=1 Tax=Streptomyces venezuelae TaxID=54571 RepID=UPI003456E24E
MSETSRMGSGRVFPALPKHPDPTAPFATSWWGNAWVDALEQSALDQARLARGRTYARDGAVDTITVAPGRIVAYVHGNRPRPYRAEIRLRTMLPEHWDRFLDVVATDPARIAALLDQEMPHALADAADRADVPLLPGARELSPSCTCPDRGHPCKHAAALAYQTARLLDADPFVLLLLRGGEEQDLLDELSRRNARRGAAEAAEALRGAGATDELRGVAAVRERRDAEPARTGQHRGVEGEAAGERRAADVEETRRPAAEAARQTSPGERQPPPEGGPAFPGGDQGASDGGAILPGGDQRVADGGPILPGGDPRVPDGGSILPGGDQRVPDGGPVLPGGDPRPRDSGPIRPGGDQRPPDGGPTLPGGDQPSRDGDHPVLPGAPHAPSSSDPVLRKARHAPPSGGPLPHAALQPASDGGPVASGGQRSHPGDDAPVLPGVLAREALDTAYRSPLPAPLAPPSHPGEAPVLPALPGAPDPTALEFLITDAARRAHTFLTAEVGAGTGARANPFPFPGDDSPWHDAVRLAASHPGLTGRRTFSRQFAELARSVGRSPAELSRAAAAWRQGGEEGLATLESPWDPPAGPFDRARGALVAADLPRMTIHRNQLTNAEGTIQLRYGTDGRWYPYRSEPGGDDWWPEGESDVDPVGALAGVAEA